jgi:hypothetical protein
MPRLLFSLLNETLNAAEAQDDGVHADSFRLSLHDWQYAC